MSGDPALFDIHDQTPAYVPYRTFSTFVEDLTIPLPTEIDRSLMKGKSNGIRSQLMGAFRYLKLIDDDGRPTQLLQELVEATKTKANRPDVVRKMVRGAYPFLRDPKFSLEGVTQAKLDARFKLAGLKGDTLRKAESFFLALAREAGMKVSPYVHASRESRAKPNPAPPRQPSKRADVPEGSLDPLLAKFPTFDPAWPDETQGKWFDAYARLLDLMEGRRSGL
ncbi:MAG TPA: hypothetical protein VG820_06405 [Fimbriimonadaceae bacterium]|nr:hypothetical protein [Fimbriimonadaceae bacterium]